ncbi:hypothetical protein E1294_42050 [Nonomuraea diastatica]|uniref:Putative Flp pilus-assembly TadG-like N-terminal domain-containing protein n=2 Tax=Nonomuraea diastatica TaxID=1848329 RepID=A0A4R4WCS7_9ACTN|nr:pilus assembly protein TadG-related protein [Nonomuraea diastatica]TDD13165.1 hypothetical protein E1294_42050 [Nonomuraea diastatica]
MPALERLRSGRRERGSVTLFAVILAVAVLTVLGLLVDGGQKLRAGREAAALAEEAARAGAGSLDRADAYTRGIADLRINPEQATRAAHVYLAGQKRSGTVRVSGDRSITVTVTVSQPTLMLSMVGISSVAATGTATANLITGVEGPSR